MWKQPTQLCFFYSFYFFYLIRFIYFSRQSVSLEINTKIMPPILLIYLFFSFSLSLCLSLSLALAFALSNHSMFHQVNNRFKKKKTKNKHVEMVSQHLYLSSDRQIHIHTAFTGLKLSSVHKKKETNWFSNLWLETKFSCDGNDSQVLSSFFIFSLVFPLFLNN